MKLDQLEQLLRDIAGIDRRPFPDGAARVWFQILKDIDYRDALQAVLDHYNGAESAPSIQPGQIRRAALRAIEYRSRLENRKAITAKPHEPSDEERAASERTRAEAMAAIRAATSQAVAKVRERDPDLRPYRHRKGALTRVA